MGAGEQKSCSLQNNPGQQHSCPISGNTATNSLKILKLKYCSQLPVNTMQLSAKVFLKSSSEFLPSLQIKQDEFTFV